MVSLTTTTLALLVAAWNLPSGPSSSRVFTSFPHRHVELTKPTLLPPRELRESQRKPPCSLEFTYFQHCHLHSNLRMALPNIPWIATSIQADQPMASGTSRPIARVLHPVRIQTYFHCTGYRLCPRSAGCAHPILPPTPS